MDSIKAIVIYYYSVLILLL